MPMIKAEIMSQIEGWPKNHLSFLNFPPDFKSKQILIGQKQFFQCLHWLTAIQNKQKGGKFELDKSHLGHPSIRLSNIALLCGKLTFSRIYRIVLRKICLFSVFLNRKCATIISTTICGKFISSIRTS